MNNLSFKKTPEEKLEWISNKWNEIDPRLSQIHNDIFLNIDYPYEDFHVEYEAIALYPSIADICLDYIDHIKKKDGYMEKYHPHLSLEYLYDLADEMYADIVQYNMWGFTFSC